MTLVPFFNSYGAYAPATAANAAVQSGNPGNPLGLQSPAFNSSFAFFMVFMGKQNLIPSRSKSLQPIHSRDKVTHEPIIQD